jgi:hypothetical protein
LGVQKKSGCVHAYCFPCFDNGRKAKLMAQSTAQPGTRVSGRPRKPKRRDD